MVLTVFAPGYFCLIMPRGVRSVHPLRKPWKENAFDMKFGTVILCNLTKKVAEKNLENCSCRDDGVTNYVIFLKNYAKNG